MTKEKALYIAEIDNGDNIQSEWFVADDELQFDEQVKKAKEHLAENFGYEVGEIKVDVLNIYRVSDDLIDEVYKSREEK